MTVFCNIFNNAIQSVVLIPVFGTAEQMKLDMIYDVNMCTVCEQGQPHSSVVGRGTALQARRWQVLIPMRSSGFLI
jgi:hypothetical protein